MDQANLIKIVAAVAVVYIVYRMFIQKKDSFDDYAAYSEIGATQPPVDATVAGMTGIDTALPMGCQPPQSISTDLLPKPDGSADDDFAQYAPDPAALVAQNFVDATKFVGVDTIGSTLKNANYGLRADIPIPRNQDTGPWLQSSIDPDLYRKPLE